MKKNLIIAVVYSLFFNSFAQTDAQNQTKYWFYRHRLTNEFLKRGPAECGLKDNANEFVWKEGKEPIYDNQCAGVPEWNAKQYNQDVKVSYVGSQTSQVFLIKYHLCRKTNAFC